VNKKKVHHQMELLKNNYHFVLVSQMLIIYLIGFSEKKTEKLFLFYEWTKKTVYSLKKRRRILCVNSS